MFLNALLIFEESYREKWSLYKLGEKFVSLPFGVSDMSLCSPFSMGQCVFMGLYSGTPVLFGVALLPLSHKKKDCLQHQTKRAHVDWCPLFIEQTIVGCGILPATFLLSLSAVR